MSEGGTATQLSRQPDLCHHLLTVMEEVDTAAPLSCQTLPDSVAGNIATDHRNTTSLHMTYLGEIMKFCTMSAVEIVKGCKNKRIGTECLVNAFTQVLKSSKGPFNFHQINIKIVASSELLYGCLCVGYLDVYSGLWTTWKLMCENSSSKLPNRTERRKLYQDLDYNEKYRPDGCGLFQRVSFETLYTQFYCKVCQGDEETLEECLVRRSTTE